MAVVETPRRAGGPVRCGHAPNQWIDPWLPAEILHDNRHAPRGVHVWSDAIRPDDVMTVDGMAVTTPARTALDMVCRYPLDTAIAAVDALANATRLAAADLELIAEHHRAGAG